MTQLSIIIREASKKYSRKSHVTSKYVTLLIFDLIIKTLSLIFYDKKTKSQEKIISK